MVNVKDTSPPSLLPEALKHRCDPEELEGWDKNAAPSETSIPVGQKRAIEALEFGLDIQHKGYNIFVLGPSGTGKTSITLQLVQERAAKDPRTQDICYLYHFDEPHRPKPYILSPGVGARLSRQIHHVISGLARSIFQVLNDEHFKARATRVSSKAESERVSLFEQISEMAEKYQLRVERDLDQFVVVPLIDGEPIESDVFDKLSIEEQDDIQERAAAFQQESAPLLHMQRAYEHQQEDALFELEQEAISGLVENTFSTLYRDFAKEPELESYFDGMKEYLLEEYRELLQLGSLEEDEPLSVKPDDLPVPYQVNVMVARKEAGGPIEVEQEPTLAHIFGYVEYRESEMGLATDHTMLHPGALHRTHGGYLILQAADLLRAPEVWMSLKRALRHREVRLHDTSFDPDKPRIYGSLRPLGMPMDVKMILIGNAESYYRLMAEDEEFTRSFKIRAEFESWMPRDQKHQLEFARFLQRVTHEESLLPLNYPAMARMVEESSREVESQRRMTTSLTASIDLLCEADYWCRKEDRQEIDVEDIERALKFREYRHESIARTIIESIDNGELLIETDGLEIGQINGLMVYISQDYSFGVPTKITCRAYAGDRGVINIDREARLSGAIHDKGSMILVGLLGGIWGQKHPFAFDASITFEQLYGDIEGDSASCAEFYALLSSLAQIPIDQGIAVTGSINQQGLLQPIGEVNAKIEGMFTICKMRGLTGNQGAIIPIQNVDHLMLKDEVIEAVEAGQFHIWPIRHVYDGIGILMRSDELSNGDLEEFRPQVFSRVEERLSQFYEAKRALPSNP